VLFMGYQQAAGEVCNTVLSACLLISPPLTGTLRRAFPYANLTNLDFLGVRGYIAGVTNPLFEQRNGWWDILANITDGTVTVSPQYQEELASSGADRAKQFDSAFVSQVLSGVELKYGEELVRCLFRDYAFHVVSMAHDDEVFSDVNSRASFMEANQFRINQFLRSNQNHIYSKTKLLRVADSAFGDMAPVVHHHVRTLQVQHVWSNDEMRAIFNDLLNCTGSDEQLLELLSLLPESEGGLFPLASNILHKDARVRSSCVTLLQRLDKLEKGRLRISSLNYFLLLTYYRLQTSVASMTQH